MLPFAWIRRRRLVVGAVTAVIAVSLAIAVIADEHEPSAVDEPVDRRESSASEDELPAIPSRQPDVITLDALNAVELPERRPAPSPAASAVSPEPEYGVTGWVVGPSGEPIDDARIALNYWDDDSPAAETGADGSFRLTSAHPARLTLFAEASGYRQREGVVVELTPSTPWQTVVLRVDAGRSISGTVAWSDGSAAAGVYVLASADALVDGRPIPVALEPAPLNSVATDTSGRYRIDDCNPMFTYTLTCVGRESDSRCRARLTARRGVHAGDGSVDLRIERQTGSLVLDGVVLERLSSLPVTSFTVDVGWWPARGGSFHRVQVEDALGRFSVDGLCAETPLRLVIEAPGLPARWIGPVTPTTAGAHLQVWLGPPGELVVHVADEHGAAIDGAAVIVNRAWGDHPSDEFERALADLTDHGGLVRWDDVPAGTYLAQASAGGNRSDLATIEVDCTRTTPLSLRIDQEPKFGSVVVKARYGDGSPIRGQPIRLWDTNGTRPWPEGWPEAAPSRAVVVTGADGEAEFVDVTAGLYSAGVLVDGMYVPSRTVRVLAGARSAVTLSP